MKALFCTALATTISLGAISQDTLFTRSGQVIPARVYEINQTDIKYRKPSNPDGPLYTISKDDIAVIEYKNGTKDVFQSGSQQDNTYSNSNSGNNVVASASPQPSTQVYNNYYGAPAVRPGVNVVLGMGMPYWGGGGWGWGGGWGGWYRPYYRPYYYGGWNHCRGHYHHR